MDDDGRHKVSRERVVFGRSLHEDEIDLEKGFIIHPNALPLATTAPLGPSPPSPGTDECPSGFPGTKVGPIIPSTDEEGTQVSYLLETTRDQLYKAWKALANLATWPEK